MARHPSHATQRSYPRVARVNEALREVIAEELERIVDHEDGLDLVTVTGVSVDPDLRHATVWFSALVGPGGSEAASVALSAYRVRMQAAVARQLRLKRTPALIFRVDPAILEGQRIEAILRALPTPAPESGQPAAGESSG